METVVLTNCSNCNKQLPSAGFFCGGCLTQFKCKSCGSTLEKDNAGCVICGTPKEAKTNSSNANTFRMHEKAGERMIDATFSDTAAKQLADMMKETYALRLGYQQTGDLVQLPANNEGNKEPINSFQSAEILNTPKQEPQQDVVTSPQQQEANYPTLKAIAMKNLPSSETEWIVVYAFYASKYGEEIFSREALVDNYSESNRKTRQRIKNLSAYITAAVKGNYLNPLQNGYSILPEGIEKAKEVISRTSGSAPKVKGTSKGKKEEVDGEKKPSAKKTSSSSGGSKRLTDIDFYPDGKESLKDFHQKFEVKNDYENNLLFVYYLQDILKISPITLNHLHTCFDELNLRIPENIKMSAQNTKARKGWIESQGKGNLAVTIKGRNKIKRWDEK